MRWSTGWIYFSRQTDDEEVTSLLKYNFIRRYNAIEQHAA